MSFLLQVKEFGPRASRKYFQPEMTTTFLDFNNRNINYLLKIAKEWNIDEKIVQRIQSWKPILLDEMKNVTDPDTSPTDFQCLCHADLWLNNVMFSHDEEGKSKDAILVSKIFFYLINYSFPLNSL